MIPVKKSVYSVVSVFVILISLAIPTYADMTVLSDLILEETVGAGLQISFTGQFDLTVADQSGELGTWLGYETNDNYFGFTNIGITDWLIKPIAYPSSGDAQPLKLEVGEAVDGDDPCIPIGGTGYLEVDLPSVAIITGALTTNVVTYSATPGVQKAFNLSFASGDLSIHSGNIKIFAH